MATGAESTGDVGVGAPVSVYYIDDYQELCTLTKRGLEAADPKLSVRTSTDPRAVFPHLDELDCIVSDYEMPDIDGLELLRQVRDRGSDVPFILFTAQGSESVASEAISLGVTDYLRKDGGSQRFDRLAHRIVSAVTAHRASTAIEQTRATARERIERERARFRALIEHSPAVTAVLDEHGTLEYVSPSIEAVAGYTPRELRGERVFEYIHAADRERIFHEFERCLADPSYRPQVQYRFRHADGSWLTIESRGVNRLDDPAVAGFIVNSRDITEQKRTEERLRRERDLTDQILEVSPSPLLLIDRTGTVHRANNRAAAVFDVKQSDLVGLSPRSPDVEFRDATGEVVEGDEFLWRTVIGTGDARHRVECQASLPFGEYRLVVSAAPLRATDGGRERSFDADPSVGPFAVIVLDEVEPVGNHRD